MRKFFVLLALPFAVGLLGACGDEARSTGEASSVSPLVGAFAGSATGLAVQVSARQRDLAFTTIEKGLPQLQERLMILAEQDPGISSDGCGSITADDGFEGATCSLSNCNFSTLPYTFSMECTGIDDQEMTCGSNSYTLSDFTYGVDFSMNASGAVTFAMDMEGDVTGSATGALDCSMGMTVSSSEYDFDCEDSNFSCTLAGTALSCSDFESSTSEMACQ